MQMNEEYLDDFFARKIGNIEVPPPEDGWRRIENELAQRSRDMRKYWLAAASLALLLSVAASVVYLQTNEPAAPVVALIEPTTDEPYQPDPQLARNEEVTQQKATSAPDRVIPTSSSRNVSSETAVASATDNVQTAIIEHHEPASQASIPPENRVASEYRQNIPIYTDTWEETVRAQLLKTKLPVILSEKPAEKTPNIVEQQPIAIAAANIPVYDDIGFANFETPVKSKSQRWEVMGKVAPVYSYRTISSTPKGMSRSDFDAAESALPAYSGGVAVAYKVVSRFSIQTGVFYSQMGQIVNNVAPVNNMYSSVSSITPFAKNLVKTSSGNVSVVSNIKSDVNQSYANYFSPESQQAGLNPTPTVSAPTKYKLIERLDYLEIPVILRYKIVDRKMNFYVLGGMSTNILVDNNVFVDTGKDVVKEGSILMARPLNYSSTFGLGVSYQITGNLLIDIEPSFKYYLQSYTTNSMVDSNPYAFGLFTGVVYRF